MKLKSYKEYLKMGKEKIEETMAPIRAREMRKKAELEMVRMEGKAVTLEAEIQGQCSKYPVDFDLIIKKQDELGLLKRREKQFKSILDDMFPEE